VFDEHPKRGIYPLLARDYDLLETARNLLKVIPVRVVGTWVKGHYKGNHYRETQHDLNDICDNLATQFMENPPQGFQCRQMPLLHPSHEAILYYSGSIVTTSFCNILYAQMFNRDLTANIMKKEHWTPQQFESVAWEAYGAAFRNKTIFQRISVAKLSHGLWNTGAQKQLFGQDPDGICPVCAQEREAVDHVFQCRHPTAMTLRRQLIEEFSEELVLLGTPGAAIRSLIEGISWWLLKSDGPCPKAPGYGSIYCTEVWSTAAYSAQTSLGWGQTFRGRLSTLWGDVYLKDNKSTSQAAHTRWTKNVIKHLWDKSFRMWTHRNEALHGKTISDQAQVKELALHSRIQEAYELHRANPSIVALSASHLFDNPIETIFLRQRQYKLCWIRSVFVAMTFQAKDTERLRRQSAKFFGTKPSKSTSRLPPAASIEMVQIPPIRTRDLPPCDISSPHSYNLRRRRHSGLTSTDDESDGFEIPPAMCEDTSESSYSGSCLPNVNLRCDFDITPTELQDLVNDAKTATPSSTVTGATASLASTSRSSGFSTPEPNRFFQRAESTGYGNIRRRTLGAPIPSFPSIPEGKSSVTHSSPGIFDFDVSVKSGITSKSSSSGQNWRHPQFPLHMIGGIYEMPILESPGVASGAFSTGGLSPQHSTCFKVLGEYHLADGTGPIFRLGQDSISGTQSIWSDHISLRILSTTSFESAHEYALVYRLVRRATEWLLSMTSRDMRDNRLTLSIYWAVRSLPVFYAPILAQAMQNGEVPLPLVDDEDWPDEPSEGDDDGDLSGLPEWLSYILTLDDLHEQGLSDITRRRVQVSGRRRRRLIPPAQLYIDDIPVRELDDPPDSRDLDSGCSGITEELSWTDISDTSR